MARVTINQDRVNVRQQPSSNSPVVKPLENGAEIIILKRTSDAIWFQVATAETPSTPLGWIANFLISIDEPGEYEEIPTVPAIASPPSPGNSGGVAKNFLEPGKNEHFEFTGDNLITTWVLLFRPDINKNGNQQLVEFIVSEDNREVGRGALYTEPPPDVDFGGLIWQGGTPGLQYRVDVNNKGTQRVELCVVQMKVHSWVCN
ncbi:MAG: SH3 domain-containing protein [Anaerolineae bacterium]|nr:SH3 domain-containing protein [Anaerolineae bacterium]